MDMQQLMRQAQQMQRQLEDAQEQLGDIEVSASAGGGMVKVTGTADGEITDIKIDGAALGLDEDDTEMLQDTILAAINEALAQAQEVANRQIGSVTGGLNIPGLF